MNASAVTLRAQQHSSPQPLADISLGAGRLASQLVNSITNPKEDKDLAKKRKEWQRKQDQEKAQQQAEQQQEQEQQQAAAAALTDPLGLADAAQEAGAAAVAAAEGAVADAAAAAAAVPEAVAVAGERSIVSEYTGEPCIHCTNSAS